MKPSAWRTKLLSTLRAAHAVECVPKATCSPPRGPDACDHFQCAQIASYVFPTKCIESTLSLLFGSQTVINVIGLVWGQAVLVPNSWFNEQKAVHLEGSVLKPLSHEVQDQYSGYGETQRCQWQHWLIIGFFLKPHARHLFGNGDWALLNSSAVQLWAWICVLHGRNKAPRKTRASLEDSSAI